MASSEVRRAVAADRFSIIKLLREAHEAAGLPFTFSSVHAAALVDRHIADPRLLALVGGEPAGGVLLAACQDHPFADVRYAAETVWWVTPSARGQFAAAMLNAYEDWGREQGCTFIGMAALAAFPRASTLYRRAGYREAETHFLKPLG